MLTTGFLSVAPVTSKVVPSSLFILASSACKSLQCLISTLPQGAREVTYLGSLVQLCCGGEEHCRQISLVYVGSACSVCTTLGLPLLMVCVLSWSTLLRLQVALQGNYLKWALSCMHFPGLSTSGDQVLDKCTLPRWVVHLITSVVPATQFPGCTVGALSQVCRVSPLGS